VTRVRIWLAHAVIGVIAGGGIVAIATDVERWPFSPYGMYSWIRPALYSANVVVGVTADTPPREILLLNARYLHPFDRARLRDAFASLLRGARPRVAVRRGLHDCLRRYERRRRAGLHDGPALRGMRLYQITWTLLPRASNVERPEGRDLLFEIEMPSRGRG
jgi:hypothetical protein